MGMAEQATGRAGSPPQYETARAVRYRVRDDRTILRPGARLGGHSLEHLAFRVLRENFSELSSEEVFTIVVAAHRVYIERNPGRSDHLRRPESFGSVVSRGATLKVIDSRAKGGVECL